MNDVTTFIGCTAHPQSLNLTRESIIRPHACTLWYPQGTTSGTAFHECAAGESRFLGLLGRDMVRANCAKRRRRYQYGTVTITALVTKSIAYNNDMVPSFFHHVFHAQTFAFRRSRARNATIISAKKVSELEHTMLRN